MTPPDDSAQILLKEPGPDATPGPLPPWRCLTPNQQTAPVVFASPHSGRDYPPEFIAASKLGVLKLRKSEDAFMDEVFAAAPDWGAPLLCAQFPRAYVDANREAFELDPEMFSDPLPDYVNTSSPRVSAGLGTIARVVTDSETIYHSPLRFEDAKRRIESHHQPYHRALKGLVEATKRRFGGCLLIDCHSMPSSPEPGGDAGAPKAGNGTKPFDVVLGDCFGAACVPAVTDIAQQAFEAMGFTVARNKPYAGGFTTRHYGCPGDGVHVLQIEINRALYMDENRITRSAGLPGLKRRIEGLMRVLVDIDAATLIAA